jgi:hypothetical protein
MVGNNRRHVSELTECEVVRQHCARYPSRSNRVTLAIRSGLDWISVTSRCQPNPAGFLQVRPKDLLAFAMSNFAAGEHRTKVSPRSGC